MSIRKTITVLFVLALLAWQPAQAHKMAPSLLMLSELSEGENHEPEGSKSRNAQSTGIFSVHWKTPLVLSSPVRIELQLPDHCRNIQQPSPQPDPVGAVYEWQVDCGARGLVGEQIAVTGLRENQSAAVVKIDLLDGRQYRQLINAAEPFYQVPERAKRGAVMWDYFKLGMDHILSGIDHLFFVWTLLLLLARRKLLAAITAFTLGHSVTLALAALNVITVPQTLTELFIAFSIFLLAVEIANKRGERGLVYRHSFVVCVTFGLLHGLGFAGALKEIGLPQEEIIAALLTFNVGVEIGQILFICCMLLLMWLISKLSATVAVLQKPISQLHWVPVYIIGVGAAFWCIERSIGLLV